MVESIFNWLVDTMARTDVIDLYFVVTDLVDIKQTPEQLAESAYYDSMANKVAGENSKGAGRQKPIGKLVL